MEKNIARQDHNEEILDRLEGFLRFGRFAWGILIATFLLGGSSNYMLLKNQYEHDKMNARITYVESQQLLRITKAMEADIVVATHIPTNRMAEAEYRILVDEIWKKYISQMTLPAVP